MNVTRKAVSIGLPTDVKSNRIRYSTRLEGEDTHMGSAECWADQIFIIKTINDSPELLFCGPSRPHFIKIYHTGARWVVEAEAIIEE